MQRSHMSMLPIFLFSRLAKASYVGKLRNGQVFDRSYNRGKLIAFRVGVGEVIKRWDQGTLGGEGIPPMLAGGKRTLRIPPALGYGESDAGNMRVEQLGVEEGSVQHQRWAKGGGWVHGLANVDSTVIVEVGAVVHEHVQVGPHSRIGSGSILGPHIIIGSHSTLWYNVSLQNCSIGDHCILHNGVSVGQDGFGFFVDEEGQMIKKPQMLQVKIGDHVEIGANTCIDRGSWRDTIIGNHTKIDNHVQIGHNVVIGHSCMVCGQAGLGGSSMLGDYVVLGGKAGVADHVSIASKVRIAAKSGVTQNITEAGDYAGFPAVCGMSLLGLSVLPVNFVIPDSSAGIPYR